MTTRDIEILIEYVKDALDYLRAKKEKARLEWEECKTKDCRNEKLLEIVDQHRKIRKIVMELKDDLDSLV
jgi:hypothetical protein